MDSQNAHGGIGFVRAPEDKHSFELFSRSQLISRSRLTVAASSDDTGTAFGVIEVVVPPGDGPGLHIHHVADELFYVLRGEFTFQIGDVRASAGVGAVAFAPHGTAHTWMSSGSEPGRMLFVFSPAGFEQFLVEMSRVPAAETLSPEAVNQMAAAYHTTFVGPPLAAVIE